MIGHEAESENLDIGLFLRVDEELQERLVIDRLAKDPHPAVAAIENMIHNAANGGPGGAGHAESI